MKGPVRSLIGIAILACCWLTISPPRAAGQVRVPRVPPNGSHAFRLILHGSGLKPLQRLPDLQEQTRHTLLIVFGDLSILEDINNLLGEDRQGQHVTGLRRFLDRGGAVLIASDRAEGARQLFQTFKVKPNGALVQNANPGAIYRGERNCPFITIFPDRNHPLFRGVEKLATNAPTFLEGESDQLSVLARFHAGCTATPVGVDGAPGWHLTNNEAFAVGNSAPTGQTLVLAGHGIFMNGMMANRDNILFARNCIDWFTRDKGRLVRSRVLFVEEDNLVKKFDVPLVELPAPPLPTIQRLNRLLRGLEDENFFNRVVASVLGPQDLPLEDRMAIGQQRILRWAFLLLTLLLVMYGLRRVWRARYPVEQVAPLLTRHVARNPSREPVLAQRQRGVLQEGHFWEAARELARQCFADYVAHAATPLAAPRVAVRVGWWRRRNLEKQVQRLWQLAYQSPARPVSSAQLTRVVADADEVKQALAAGALLLEDPTRAQPRLPQATGTSENGI